MSVRAVSRKAPGMVLGTAGGGLTGATWAVNADVARIGQSGEVRTAALLDELAHRPGGPTVLHDLRIPIPGFSANIDHALVVGTRVYLIDTKVWKPGFYWTFRGKTRRGTEVFPPADKRTMELAERQIEEFLSQRVKTVTVAYPLLVVWPSSTRAPLRTWFLTVPMARVVSGEKFTRMLRSGSLVKPADPKVVATLARLLNAPPQTRRRAA